MATINLAPGTQYLAGIRRRRQSLFMLAGGVALATVVVWAGLFVWQQRAQQQFTEVQASVASIERRIVEAGPDVQRITLFEQRLGALENLLENHLSYGPILRELERLLPGPTVLQEISIDADLGSVTLIGVTPNVDEVAQTLASLSSDTGHPTLFKRVELGTVTRNEVSAPDGVVTTSYGFQANLEFRPDVLRQGFVNP